MQKGELARFMVTFTVTLLSIWQGFFLREEAKVYELSGPDVMAVNDFDNPERISIKDKTIKNISSRFSYVFPAHSATIIEVEIK